MHDDLRVLDLGECALPCGVLDDDGEPCGRAARLAYLEPDPDRAGRWLLTPVCRYCAMATAALYAHPPASDATEPVEPGRS